jgi:hypothetical protein
MIFRALSRSSILATWSGVYVNQLALDRGVTRAASKPGGSGLLWTFSRAPRDSSKPATASCRFWVKLWPSWLTVISCLPISLHGPSCSSVVGLINKLNLNEDVRDRRDKVTFHTLRHTYASMLVQKGLDIYHVKELLGHSSIALTESYSHLSESTLKHAALMIQGE